MDLALGTTFVVYFLIVAVIGVVAWHRTSTVSDYVLGDRRLGAGVAALSAGASDMSGWLMLGLPGAIYLAGVGEAWIVVGLVIGAYLNWRCVAPRLRDFTGAVNAHTLPEFFARRFADPGPWFQLVATLIILFFFTVYTASGFVSGAKLFGTMLGIDYAVALWSGIGVIMLYTALGGFLAVSWTDVFQALLMVAALAAVPALAWQASGAPVAVDWGAFVDPTVAVTVSSLAWGLGYFGQPHIVVRFMAMHAKGSPAAARRTAMTWMVLCCAGAVSVGLAGRAWVDSGAPPPADPEAIFIEMTRILLNPWVAGFVLAAILAAIMSTVSSQLLVASTCLAQDTLRPKLPTLGDRTILRWSQAAVVVMAAIAGVLAMDPHSRVLALVAYAWAGLGASLGPLMLFSLFWRRTTRPGALLGMIVGGITVMIWGTLEGGVFDLYELLPGFVLASVTIVVASLVGRRDGAAEKEFDLLSGARAASAAHLAGP